jgi:hypothetical protein
MRFASLLLVTTLCTSAAGGTIVLSDSGNVGEFRATNMGVSAGTATISFAIPGITSQINTVNGGFVAPEPIKVNTPLTLLVTPTGPETYSLALSPSEYMTTIGATPGAQAVLGFTMDTGIAPAVLPSFFNLSGRIVAVLDNSNPLYDFGSFATGGTMNITLTATSFTGAADFASFLATPGALAVGNGSFSQAVAEPSAAGLLGIGMSLLFAVGLRRRS